MILSGRNVWHFCKKGICRFCNTYNSSCEIALFCDITQRRVVILYQSFGKNMAPISKGQEVQHTHVVFCPEDGSISECSKARK
jgi:hypothetical protein